MLKELSAIQKEKSKNQQELKMFEKCDPKRVGELEKLGKVGREAEERWTDKLYQVQKYMRQCNPGQTIEELESNFEVFKNLEYP